MPSNIDHYGTAKTRPDVGDSDWCPFCDKELPAGHIVKDNRVTQCPSIGMVMTPAAVIHKSGAK